MRTRVVAALLLVLGVVGATAAPARADAPAPGEVSAALAYLNGFRAQFGTPAATDDPGMDAGAQAHAAYMAATGVVGHSEDPSSPYYSDAGNTAAGCGDEAPGAPTLDAAVDEWMRAPFHALIELGAFGDTVFGLGRSGAYASLTCAGSLAATPPAHQLPAFPATYPGDGGTLPYYTFGGESPEPRTACAGGPDAWQGFGLIAAFGGSAAITSDSATLTRGGTALPVCVVDENNTTGVGQSILAGAHAVIVFPQAPLKPAASYEWTTVANGVSVTRSFTTAPAQLAVTAQDFSEYPRDLLVTVSSPDGSGAGTVTVDLRASNGDASTAPVVASAAVQPGTDTWYANLVIPDSLGGSVNYVVSTEPKAGYLGASASGQVVLPAVEQAAPPPPPPPAAPRASCSASVPKTVHRHGGKAKLTVTQRCSGSIKAGTLLLQVKSGRHWVTVARVRDPFRAARVAYSATVRTAAHRAYRWVATSGSRTVVTSGATQAV